MAYIGVDPNRLVSLILYEYTATNGQTTFSGSDDNSATLSYTVDNLQVVMNGVILDPSDYTATNGTSVVLAAGAATNDLVNIYAFKSFTTADMVSKTNGGTFAGPITVSGAFTSPGIDDNADATAITIDSSETVLVGKSASDFDTAGFQTASNGQTAVTRASATPLFVNRKTDDGDIIDIRKDNTTVGSVGSKVGDLTIGTDDTGFRFYDAGNAVLPYNPSTQASPANTVDLGDSGSSFKDLYLGGNLYIGGTGSSNALDDYEEGSWNPQVGGSATYLSQKGIYTKIGNIVTVHFDIEINAIGTGSNTRITNFPFTANSSGTPLYAGCVSFFSGINSSNTFIGMYVIDGTTECNFTGGTANATTISQNGFAIFGNNARVIGSVAYRTA